MTDIEITDVTEEEIAYNEAADAFDDAWGLYMISVADGASADEQEQRQNEFILAEHRAHDLWVCWKQNHPHREIMGEIHFSGGEIYDDTVEVCVVCGRQPKYVPIADVDIDESQDLQF